MVLVGGVMWRKRRSAFQYHMKYIHTYTLKNFRVSILQYVERIREMHELGKYLPPPPKKGDMYSEANWRFRNHNLI